jgi:type I restriction enzyme, S subunit
MTEETATNAPQIRFKGFEAAWQRKRLGEIYTERNERGNDSLPILSVSIHSAVSNGELDSETLGKKVRRSEDKSLYKHVYAGDLVLNMMRAWQGALGVAKIEAMVSPAYITAIPDRTIYPLFMDCGLRRPQVVASMDKLSYGVTDFRKRLYWDSFVRVDFDIPSVSEQQKITDFFAHLDSTIALHQRKHDKLVTLKKAMLQKMFPQPGATSPEIRFKGFSGTWAQKGLGEATTHIANNTLSRANLNYRSGLAKNVHYGDILVRFGEILDVQGDGVPFVTDDGLAKKLMPSKLQNGDVVLADAAEDEMVGKCTEIQNVRAERVLAGLHTIALRPLIDFAPFYLGYHLNSNAFHSQLRIIMQGTKVLSISKTAIKQTIITFPADKDEQQRIGAYFRTLDRLISKHAIQLQKLKQIKSAFLEKMFV